MFEEVFPLTDAAPVARSAIEALGLPGARPRTPGVYGDGLVVLLSDDFDARKWFDSWPPILPGYAPIGYTGLGDFLLWDYEERSVQYLQTQTGVLTEAG